jgi:hypothetical protein
MEANAADVCDPGCELCSLGLSYHHTVFSHASVQYSIPQTLRGARFAIVDFVHHNWFHAVHQNIIYRSTWTI